MKGADNTILIASLDNWGRDPSGVNFEKVMHELINGNSYLMLPSVKKHSTGFRWTTSKDETLELTCIFEVDGLKTLGAFTDERAITNWTNKPQPYISMKTKDVLDLCEKNNIYNLVINSDSPNIFLARRFRNHLN